MILAMPQNLFGLPGLTTKIVALFLAALSEAAWITGQGFLLFQTGKYASRLTDLSTSGRPVSSGVLPFAFL